MKRVSPRQIGPNQAIDAEVDEVGASVATKGNRSVFAYLAILGATLSGYAGVQPWAIAAAAIALASLSYAEYGRLYRRGQEVGLSEVVDSVILRSFLNALIAAGGAYGLGWLLRII